METTFEAKKSDFGYNAKRLREILGVKQEDLAERMGVSQQTVSRFEQTAQLDDETLDKIAAALNIPVDAIKNFSEEGTFNIVANTFTDFKDNAVASAMNYHPTFNAMDKIVELFERLLKAEQEKVQLLQEVLKDKK